jgi:hypothetical protein
MHGIAAVLNARRIDGQSPPPYYHPYSATRCGTSPICTLCIGDGQRLLLDQNPGYKRLLRAVRIPMRRRADWPKAGQSLGGEQHHRAYAGNRWTSALCASAW